MRFFPLHLLLAVAVQLGSPPAHAQHAIGVVLMHGKQSAPGEHDDLAGALVRAGYAVERPEMCWSNRRIYDLPYLDCLREIHAAIARLKSRGATEFVVAGHSLGANAALAYGAVNRGLKGIVALAPGHRPEMLSRRPQIAAGLAAAREHVSKGRGNATASFPDVNGALLITVTATANAYLSFLAPELSGGDAGQRSAAHGTAALHGWDRRSVATRAGRNLRQGAVASAQSLRDGRCRPLRHLGRFRTGDGGVAEGTGEELALLWHFLFKPLAVAYPFSAVWTSTWWWPGELLEDGATYGGQSWLGRWAGGSFFSVRCCRGGGAAGRRRRSSSSAHGGEALPHRPSKWSRPISSLSC